MARGTATIDLLLNPAGFRQGLSQEVGQASASLGKTILSAVGIGGGIDIGRRLTETVVGGIKEGMGQAIEGREFVARFTGLTRNPELASAVHELSEAMSLEVRFDDRAIQQALVSLRKFGAEGVVSINQLMDASEAYGESLPALAESVARLSQGQMMALRTVSMQLGITASDWQRVGVDVTESFGRPKLTVDEVGQAMVVVREKMDAVVGTAKNVAEANPFHTWIVEWEQLKKQLAEGTGVFGEFFKAVTEDIWGDAIKRQREEAERAKEEATSSPYAKAAAARKARREAGVLGDTSITWDEETGQWLTSAERAKRIEVYDEEVTKAIQDIAAGEKAWQEYEEEQEKKRKQLVNAEAEGAKNRLAKYNQIVEDTGKYLRQREDAIKEERRLQDELEEEREREQAALERRRDLIGERDKLLNPEVKAQIESDFSQVWNRIQMGAASVANDSRQERIEKLNEQIATASKEAMESALRQEKTQEQIAEAAWKFADAVDQLKYLGGYKE